MSAKLRRKNDKGEKYPENLAFDLDSQVFIWRERIAGVDHWKSTGTDLIGLARQKVKTFRQEATGVASATRGRRTFNELFDLTVEIKSARGAKTLKSAIDQLQNLRPWFQEHCPYLDTFERDHDEVWSRYQNDQADLTPGRKLQHDREILLFALKRARGKGWISRDFGKESDDRGKIGLHLNEVTEPIGKVIEDEDVNWLLTAARINPTLLLQIRMAVLMGMRNGEILKARWSEFDWKSGEIVIGGKRVKTRKGRRIPIHGDLLPELRSLHKKAEGDFVFPADFTRLKGKVDPSKPQTTNHKAYDRARARAARLKAKDANPKITREALRGVERLDCRFHDLRHTYMSNAMAEGMQPAEISKITGASLKVVMEIYYHLRGDVREKAKKLFCGKYVGAK
jgi:integrase